MGTVETHTNGVDLMEVFVFGSNLAGRHGKGAALEARKNWGAITGQGEGFMYQNALHFDRGCYGIATKDERLRTRSLPDIQQSVETFLRFANRTPAWSFLVTRIGCGLAGYLNEEIAPMFLGASDNCEFDPAWARFGLKTWLTQQDIYETNPERL